MVGRGVARVAYQPAASNCCTSLTPGPHLTSSQDNDQLPMRTRISMVFVMWKVKLVMYLAPFILTVKELEKLLPS